MVMDTIITTLHMAMDTIITTPHMAMDTIITTLRMDMDTIITTLHMGMVAMDVVEAMADMATVVDMAGKWIDVLRSTEKYTSSFDIMRWIFSQVNAYSDCLWISQTLFLNSKIMTNIRPYNDLLHY